MLNPTDDHGAAEPTMTPRLWKRLEKRRLAGQDANFDRLGGQFEDVVYGSTMGDVRLVVLLEDVLANIPSLRAGGVRVLDAGGGSGRFALELARLGNEVVLADPSREMLDRAGSVIEAAGLTGRVRLVQAGIEDLEGLLDEQFEVIACHAVLNWVAEPKLALGRLARSLAPHGSLSLMFGGRAAWLFEKILKGDLSGFLEDPDPDSLRAPHAQRVRLRRLSRLPSGWSELGWGPHAAALPESAVRAWLADAGLVVRSKAGIRMFHDYLPEAPSTAAELEDLVEVEKALRNTEPFASLAKLIHLVCSRDPA
jgi:S-adenosylmethionine-dependent methyltransferase